MHLIHTRQCPDYLKNIVSLTDACATRPGRVFTNPRTAQRHLKSVKIAAIHSNRTTLTLTLNPKLKITPFLTLTLNRRWAVRGFVIMRPGMIKITK